MIRTKPPSDEYRDGWDRVFDDMPAQPKPVVDVKAVVERLVVAYRDSGGDPDAVFVCNSHVHREYLDSAAVVLGYPVQIREWVPTPNTLLEPVSELRAQDKVYAEMDCAFSEAVGLP